MMRMMMMMVTGSTRQLWTSFMMTVMTVTMASITASTVWLSMT